MLRFDERAPSGVAGSGLFRLVGLGENSSAPGQLRQVCRQQRRTGSLPDHGPRAFGSGAKIVRGPRQRTAGGSGAQMAPIFAAVVMLHEIEYLIDNKLHRVESSLITIGTDEQRTAMAKTVGLPLGIAAVLILEGKLNVKGLHIPINAAIYEPVLAELANESIEFTEIHY